MTALTIGFVLFGAWLVEHCVLLNRRINQAKADREFCEEAWAWDALLAQLRVSA